MLPGYRATEGPARDLERVRHCQLHAAGLLQADASRRWCSEIHGPYAKMHDDAIWDALDGLFGGRSPEATVKARALAELLALLGGRSGWQSDASALRTRSSAWGWSWAQRSAAGGTREPYASCAVVWVSARVVAKVVVPFSRLSTAHRRRHSIGQYVVGACWRQPKKTRPRARQGPQPGRVVSILDVGYVACCPV